MKTSCIAHPDRERLVIIRKWQDEFCDGNKCAAAVLSHFEYWHNWKLDSDEYNQKSNDIAETHGDTRQLSENVYQFHSMKEISDGILNLYGEKAIAEAIKLLESKKAISTHSNPNPNYFYDKKKYFIFYPDVCNEWIKNHYKSRLSKKTECTQQKSVPDSAKRPSALGENTALLGKNTVSITKINNKDNNKSINAREALSVASEKISTQPLIVDSENNTQAIQPVLDALTARGLPAKRFHYPDALLTLEQLVQEGAGVEIFCNAYDLAFSVTHHVNGFGINYLAKVVRDLLAKSKRPAISTTQPRVANSVNHDAYTPDATDMDLTNGAHWLTVNEETTHVK
jgi:hypothetical protein